MWRCLETGQRRDLASLNIRCIPSHIHYIYTVNTPILYLSWNNISKKNRIKFFNKKKDSGNPMRSNEYMCDTVIIQQ